ncbi:MAG: phosphoribosyl-ATP diphosphatase [Phycisphaerales bacterium]
MIIPSIDLIDGDAVQLIGGREKAIDAGDARPIAERFALVGEIAVIDLDAALGRGSNESTILELLELARCRVGGGVRSVDAAVRWLDAGAAQVILGTAAQPKILRELPRDRVIAALDAEDGDIVVEGWRRRTGARVEDRMRELAEYAGGFLVTLVEREGRLGGADLERAAALAEVAHSAGCRLTLAGGVTTTEEIAALDALGVDAQVGMALYSRRMNLGDAVAAPMRSDRPDSLWPTVIVDESGVALGLAYSSAESLRQAIETRTGVYFSRSRRELWTKGATSGATQDLLRVDLDCDRDALRFTVRQRGAGFCHVGTRTCWGPDRGLPALSRRLADRVRAAPAGSYTRRLLNDPALLRSKLIEESGELADASDSAAVAHEAADVLYFALVAAANAGVSLEAIESTLDRRALGVTRRPGDAKAPDSREAGVAP